MIKAKQGHCADCGKITALIAGRCHFHYWKYRNQLKTAKNKAKGKHADVYEERKALDKWFAEQVANMPSSCENCGDPLIKFAPWAAKAYIAHVLPKRNFNSIKLHSLNRLYLCLICHTNYDNAGSHKVQQMPVFKVAVERFIQMKASIPPDECRLIPSCFIDASHEAINVHNRIV